MHHDFLAQDSRSRYFHPWRGRSAFQCMELKPMKQTTGVYAVLTAALFLGSMAGVGCGGDDDTTGSAGAGGSGGSATGGADGKGGSAGSGGATGGTGGTAGTAGSDAGGKGGAAGADAGSDGPVTMTCGTRI